MMITVNRVGDSITGSLNGKPFGVSYDQERYKTMKNLEQAAADVSDMEELKQIVEDFKPLTIESYKELAETKCPYIHVNNATGKFYLQLNADVISKRALPQQFVDRILTSIDKDMDFMPLIKCWVRFLRNPHYSDSKARRFANYLNKTYVDRSVVNELLGAGLSNQVATERATVMQTPITQEGLICTYKVSRELTEKFVLDAEGNKKSVARYQPTIDEFTGIVTYAEPDFVEERVFEPACAGQHYDAFYSGDVLAHIIRVGQRHYLPDWSQVDTNDNTSGVKGLHCGNLDYIRGFQQQGTVTHNVFVDPMFIGAITDDGSGALRVKDYFVHSSFGGVNKSIYHSSEYAKVGDTEYEEMIADAIKKTGEWKDSADADLAEVNALAAG